MATETIRGYKVEYDIDPVRVRKLIEFFLDFDMRCTDGKHAIMKINDIRIRFKYEGMKREYIEIKELKKNKVNDMAISDIVWQSIKDIESKTSQVMIENLDFNEYFKWIPADEPDKKEGFCKPFLN